VTDVIPFASPSARRRALGMLVFIPLAGCGLAPERPHPPARHDLGPVPAGSAAAPALPQALEVAPVLAPDWLEGTALAYRLLWETPGRLRAYAATGWAAPPSALLTERLRERAFARAGAVRPPPGGDGAPAVVLRVDLAEFAQWFEAPDRARAVVRVRAGLLVVRTRAPVAGRTFTAERPCRTPDAPGAVDALIAASQSIVEEVLDWAADTLAGGK